MTLEEVEQQACKLVPFDAHSDKCHQLQSLIRAAWREAYEAGKRDGRLALVNALQDVGDDVGRCVFDTRNAAGIFRRCTRGGNHSGECM